MPRALFGEIKRTVVQDGERHKTGIRVWEVDHSAARGMRASLYGQRFPNETGDDAPYCYNVQIGFDEFNKGLARLVAYYRTRRQPKTARVSIISQAVTRTVTTDLNGKTIIGPYFDESDASYGHGCNYYKIVQGSNVQQEGQSFVRVEMSFERTGFNAREIQRIMLLQGRVNDSDLPNFGDFPKGTLKLEKSPLTQQWEESGLWYLDLVFGVSPILPEPWNDWTKKQLHSKAARQYPVLDASGAIIANSFRTVEYERPRRLKVTAGDSDHYSYDNYDATIHPTRLFREADFTDIDRIIIWD